MIHSWSKQEIEACKSALVSWWLETGDQAGTRETLAQALDHHRKDILLQKLRERRDMLASRYREQCETIGNAIVRFPEDKEMPERFRALALETDKQFSFAERLVLTVYRCNLPSDVREFSPWNGT